MYRCTGVVPGQCNLSLLPGDVSCLLGSLHGAVHLLPDLTGPQRDQVLPLSTHQDVLFVLPFLFGAVRECGTAVTVAFVAKPLPLVLQSVGSSAETVASPFVILPLPAVHLGRRGIHVIVGNNQLGIRVSKAEKVKSFTMV